MSRDDQTMMAPPSIDALRPVQATREAFSTAGAHRYEPMRILGEGGMGTVDLVRDEVVGRDVARKRVRPLFASDPEVTARFEREIRLQGQLEHPAIVPVYDAGVAEDGSLFFTMKRIRGDALSDILAKMSAGEPTRFSRRKLLVAFGQLCLALQYAHERGVVHRDIKPSNVMLGAYGEVYILDWGVAKVAGEPDVPYSSDRAIRVATGRTLTEAGDVMGTPSTMAPEQAVGQTVDARADVYALGAVLFEILTLQPLHPEGDPSEVIARIVDGVDARPSVRAPSMEVPPELEALCVAATRPVPEERLPSALALHDALEAYLDGDRDQSLRREGAARHAATAQAEADALLGTKSPPPADEEARRKTALHEVGRALALDPQNRDALGTLVRLLTTPPRVVPQEVVLETEANAKRRIRIGGIACVIVYAYISLNAIATWQLGVKDPHVIIVAHSLWSLAVLTSALTVWRPSYFKLLTTFAIGVATSVYITRVYGPHLLVPTLLTMHGVLFAQTGSRPLRIAVIAATSIAWTVSLFGESAGLFPEVVRFADGRILMESPVIGFPKLQTTIYLWSATLAAIVGPGAVIGALRAAWQKSDDAMRVQSWQLRRLVSDQDRSIAPR